jgi:hypothetical protein
VAVIYLDPVSVVSVDGWAPFGADTIWEAMAGKPRPPAEVGFDSQAYMSENAGSCVGEFATSDVVPVAVSMWAYTEFVDSLYELTVSLLTPTGETINEEVVSTHYGWVEVTGGVPEGLASGLRWGLSSEDAAAAGLAVDAICLEVEVEDPPPSPAGPAFIGRRRPGRSLVA